MCNVVFITLAVWLRLSHQRMPEHKLPIKGKSNSPKFLSHKLNAISVICSTFCATQRHGMCKSWNNFPLLILSTGDSEITMTYFVETEPKYMWDNAGMWSCFCTRMLDLITVTYYRSRGVWKQSERERLSSGISQTFEDKCNIKLADVYGFRNQSCAEQVLFWGYNLFSTCWNLTRNVIKQDFLRANTGFPRSLFRRASQNFLLKFVRWRHHVTS